MGEAIGAVLGNAVGVAISPVPIIAVILILFSPTARVNGPAFLAGWVVGLAVACTAFALLGPLAGGDDPSAVAGWLRLVIGGAFAALAVRQWRSRPAAGEEPQLPGWMAAVAGFSAIRAFGTGALLSGVNPKNLGLAAAAGASIGAAELGVGSSVVVVAVFVAIGAVSVAAPVVFALVAPTRADAVLADVREWLTATNATVMTVLFAVLAAKLVGDALAILG